MKRLTKGIATEMILTIGVLVASGILLLQLRGVFYGQTKLSQGEIAGAFANDLENIVDKAVAVTGNATFAYHPAIKSYTLTVSNDTVLIYDKISKVKAGFTKTSVNLQDISFEDSEVIYITKVEDGIYILGKCRESGESCSNSMMCCHENPYCWGSSFVCHNNCASLGEKAADNDACCSGLFLNTSTGGCEKIPCIDDGRCENFECSAGCKDCIGPNPTCIGDGACTVSIKENCANSPNDCSCSNGICCPDQPDANGIGCSLTTELDLKKSEKCSCDAQCDVGLKCNPTAPSFTTYSKACCEPGKGWDGSNCIVLECEYPCLPGCILPSKFDWRNFKGENWMTPIRRQHCGDCWAFSAAGAVEANYKIEQGNSNVNPDLSEQDLVSCSGAGSCSGGKPFAALSYIKSTGICDESCFPEVGKDLPCSDKRSDCGNKLWKINSYSRVTETTDEIKRALICHGPLSAIIPTWEHAIVVVGYDDTRTVWIFKNSWGGGFGYGGESGGYGALTYDKMTEFYYVDGVRAP